MWFGQKAVFLGDDAADALVSYAAHVAQLRTGDSIDLRGINAEGNEITTTFLLNPGTTLTAETTNMALDEPDNHAAIAYIRDRIKSFSFDTNFFEGFRFEGDVWRGILATLLLLAFSYAFGWISALIGISVKSVEAANSGSP